MKAPETHRETAAAASDFDEALAYPTLRRAAHILAVDVSTLSRREDLAYERVGREKRVHPWSVLELADYYRRRPLATVAGDLVRLAYEVGEPLALTVERHVDAYFAHRQPPSMPAEHFLAEARRSLPLALYAEVEAAYRHGDIGADVSGAVSAGLEEDEASAA